MLSTKDRKRLRQVAHHLEPTVFVGERGVTPAVIQETQRALTDHELIKARINVPDRTERRANGRHLAESCAAEVVQEIGKVIVMYRGNPDADPRLSNVTRYA